MSRSPAEIQSDVQLLEEFTRGYKAYFEVADEDGTIPVVKNKAPLRDRLHRQLLRVERIMKRAGTDGFGFGPPRMAAGHPGRIGVVACAFADEDPVYSIGGGPPCYETVLDRIAMTFGVLEDELANPEANATDELAKPEAHAKAEPRAAIRFEVVPSAGRYRAIAKLPNGERVWWTEDYASKAAARKAIDLLRRGAAAAQVHETVERSAASGDVAKPEPAAASASPARSRSTASPRAASAPAAPVEGGPFRVFARGVRAAAAAAWAAFRARHPSPGRLRRAGAWLATNRTNWKGWLTILGIVAAIVGIIVGIGTMFGWWPTGDPPPMTPP